MAFLRCSILKEVLRFYTFVSGFDTRRWVGPREGIQFWPHDSWADLGKVWQNPPHNEQFQPLVTWVSTDQALCVYEGPIALQRPIIMFLNAVQLTATDDIVW